MIYIGKWKVTFYNQNVYNVLMSWPTKLKGRYIKLVELMEKYGTDLGMPYTRTLGNGLFELRVKGQEGIGRVFFCYTPNRGIVMLHGFIKKTQKTPNKELKLAKDRLKEIKNYAL